MKRWVLLSALLVLAMAATFAAQKPGADSPLPTVDNRGPRGLAVLATWLGESGREVRVIDGEIPREVKTVVLAAPSADEFSEAEVEPLRRFVEAGGTLVYLVPRQAPQAALNRWLGVATGALAPLNDEPGVTDVGGSTVTVSGVAGIHTLRVSAERTLDVQDAVQVAEHGVLWTRELGDGRVWLSAGADLAENARLELADNARFWSRLPAPIAFNERHQRVSRALPINFAVTALQLLLLAGLFLWARGRRLGPPRDPLVTAHVSTMDYVRALANLLRNANVEPELIAALKRELSAAGVDASADDLLTLSRHAAERARARR